LFDVCSVVQQQARNSHCFIVKTIVAKQAKRSPVPLFDFVCTREACFSSSSFITSADEYLAAKCTAFHPLAVTHRRKKSLAQQELHNLRSHVPILSSTRQRKTVSSFFIDSIDRSSVRESFLHIVQRSLFTSSKQSVVELLLLSLLFFLFVALALSRTAHQKSIPILHFEIKLEQLELSDLQPACKTVVLITNWYFENVFRGRIGTPAAKKQQESGVDCIEVDETE
jgi:hypothetical protein